MCRSSYNFSQYLWHTTNGLNKKFPIKTCGVSDDLSGDMLAPSWPNLVYIFDLILVIRLTELFVFDYPFYIISVCLPFVLQYSISL